MQASLIFCVIIVSPYAVINLWDVLSQHQTKELVCCVNSRRCYLRPGGVKARVSTSNHASFAWLCINIMLSSNKASFRWNERQTASIFIKSYFSIRLSNVAWRLMGMFVWLCSIWCIFSKNLFQRKTTRYILSPGCIKPPSISLSPLKAIFLEWLFFFTDVIV